MIGTWYIVGVLAIAFIITFALRALPFAILKPLRESKVVRALSVWMPVGILAILAAETFRSTIVDPRGDRGGGHDRRPSALRAAHAAQRRPWHPHLRGSGQRAHLNQPRA